MQDTTQFLYLFLSPTLDSCALSSLYPESKSIGTRCVVLKELIILPAVGRTTNGSLLSDTIRSCKKLVRVCCSPLDSAAWKHLTSLHTLRAIEIDGSNCPLDLDDFIFAPFLNVTTLSFVVDKAEDNIRLIQRSQFPSLKEFEFTMGSQALSWAEVEQLFRGLSQCKACQTLERITLDSHYASEIHQRTGDSFTAIRQLSRFTQLQTLSLSIGNFIYPDNDLLLEAASSWPHLRCLKLVDYYFPRPSAVTFCGLFAALRLCPHLHTLWLSMDAVNIDTDPAAESFQHTSLKTFHVLSSSVAHPETVACIISSMLPCVAQVDYDTWSEGNIAMSWAAVNDLLKNFKSSAAAVRGITGVKQH